jgi:hypothetical protein
MGKISRACNHVTYVQECAVRILSTGSNVQLPMASFYYCAFQNWKVSHIFFILYMCVCVYPLMGSEEGRDKGRIEMYGEKRNRKMTIRCRRKRV